MMASGCSHHDNCGPYSVLKPCPECGGSETPKHKPLTEAEVRAMLALVEVAVRHGHNAVLIEEARSDLPRLAEDWLRLRAALGASVACTASSSVVRLGGR